MGKTTKTAKTIEILFQELNTIITKLDQEDVSLEDSFVLYQEGIALLKTCSDKIDTVEKQLILLDEVSS